MSNAQNRKQWIRTYPKQKPEQEQGDHIMPVQQMTAKWLDGARPQEGKTRTDYRDVRTPGLYLRVTRTGKTWAFVYKQTRNKKVRRLVMGNYPAMTLAMARQQAGEYRVMMEQGKDPWEHQQEERRQTEDAISFEHLAEIYLEKHAKRHKRSWKDDEYRIRRELLPVLSGMKADEVRKADILAIVERIGSRNARYEANRVRALVHRMYNFGQESDLCQHNPAEKLPKGYREIPRKRYLETDEIRTFWHWLDTSGMAPAMAIILKLCLVTGQRLGEIARARRHEIDMDQNRYLLLDDETVNRTIKNCKDHLVPLTPLSRDLFGRALGQGETLDRDNQWVFANPDTGKPYRVESIGHRLNRAAMEEMGLEPFHAHDLRRTVSSHMRRLGINGEHISRVMNHSVGYGVCDGAAVTSIHYDAYAYEKEKRLALEAWDRELQRILYGQEEESGGKVCQK